MCRLPDSIPSSVARARLLLTAASRSRPALRFPLIDEERIVDDADWTVRARNVVDALFRLERNRDEEDVLAVLQRLSEWLCVDEQTALQDAFIVWVNRVLISTRWKRSTDRLSSKLLVSVSPIWSARAQSRQLSVLNQANSPDDMNLPSWSLHPLRGNLSERWPVSVSGKWRLTSKFDNGDVILVDYQDYH